MATPPPEIPAVTRLLWHFGDVELDEAARELRRGGQVIEVEPKQIDLLMFLLRRPGEVVSREEIQAAVWPGRILGDGAVTNCVAKLREALNDRDQSMVRTVQRAGYLFAAEARSEAAHPALPGGGFEAGGKIPLRPGWRLLRALSSGVRTPVWLAQRADGDEKRVLRLARDKDSLALIKHEAALLRLLREKRAGASDYRLLLDWNFDEPPYFLEFGYAGGGDLRQWCEGQGGVGAVPLEMRIALAAEAAAALAATHAAGIVHGRLEPSSLLVDDSGDDKPRLRLSDFSAAQPIGQERQPDAAAAAPTAIYQAPELLARLAPTVQSDIYALGVLLFQLATGDLQRPLAPGWEDAVEDPLLREDIAAAATGDVSRRLSDAAELAARLRELPQRHAAREAQRRDAATADSARRQRLQQRRLRELWVALILVVIFTGLLVGTLYLRARAAEAQAQAEDAAMATISELLAEGQPAADAAADTDAQFAALLDRAAASLDSRLPDQPGIRARLQLLLGRAYGLHDDLGKAEPQLLRAERNFTAALGPASAEAQDARRALRDAYRNAGEFDKMREVAARIVAAEESAGRPRSETWYDGAWGVSLGECIKRHGAKWLGDCSSDIFALADRAAVDLGRQSPGYRRLLAVGGAVAVHSGIKAAQAEPRLREAYRDTLESSHGGDPQLARLRLYWAAAQCAAGQPAQGLALLDQPDSGPSDSRPAQLRMLAQLFRARCLLDQGQARAAADQAGAAYQGQLSGKAGRQVRLGALEAEVSALIADRRGAEALALVRTDLDRAGRDGTAADPYELLRRHALLADAMAAAGEANTEAQLRANLAEARGLLHDSQWLLGYCAASLGQWLTAHGHAGEGKDLLSEGEGLLRTALGDDDARLPALRRIYGARPT